MFYDVFVTIDAENDASIDDGCGSGRLFVSRDACADDRDYVRFRCQLTFAAMQTS